MNIRSKGSFSSFPNKANEDSIGFTKNAFWVIDGATNVFGDQKITKLNVTWFVNRITEMLKTSLNDCKHSIQEILKMNIQVIEKEAKTITGEEFSGFSQQIGASILVCRFFPNNLEIFSLGDCVGYLQIGEHELLLQNYNMMRIERNLTKRAFVHKKNMNHEEFCRRIAFPMCQELMKKNEQEKLYSSVKVHPDSISSGFQLNIPITSYSMILLMTDGFSRLIEYYQHYKDFNELLTNLETIDVKELYNKLRDIESNDPEAIKFPRFKIHDDSSLILAIIS